LGIGQPENITKCVAKAEKNPGERGIPADVYDPKRYNLLDRSTLNLKA